MHIFAKESPTRQQTLPSSLSRRLLAAGGATSILLFLLGTGCSSPDFQVLAELEFAEITIDVQSPDELADVEIQITLESGRYVDRCIETEIQIHRGLSEPERILELEPDADFDPCFDGQDSRSVTFHNEVMSNADLLSLCQGDESWDLTMFVDIKDDEKTGWLLTSTRAISLNCE